MENVEKSENIERVENSRKEKKNKKRIGLLLFIIVLVILLFFGWKYKEQIATKAEDVKIEMTTDKAMSDLRESNTENFGEHTDRNEFDAVFATIRAEASIIPIDSEKPIENEDDQYIEKVFRKYTGIEERSRVKFVSAMCPSWEEKFVVIDGDNAYSNDHFFAVLVLANSEEDAEIVINQMQNNLKPWEWETKDMIADENGQTLFIEIPYKKVKEEDVNFYKNGEYVLFVINDKNAVEEGTQKSFDYMTRLLDKAIEDSREYYSEK